jgi:hypothetical protein
MYFSLHILWLFVSSETNFSKSNVYGSKLDSISGVCAPRYGRQYHVQGPPYVIVVRGLEATEPMERDAVPEDVVNEVLERIAPQPGFCHC